MTRRLIKSTSAEVRLAAAEDWLSRRGAAERLLVVAESPGGANELLRRVALIRGAVFGWRRSTPSRLAGELAGPLLVARGRSVAGALATEALAARVIDGLRVKGGLGRFAPVGDRPGFAAALARTLLELRLAEVATDALERLDPDLARLRRRYEGELRQAGMADRATVFRLAREAVEGPEREPVGLPLLLLDPAVQTAAERALLAALGRRSPDVLATLPGGDGWAAAQLEQALGVSAEDFDVNGSERPDTALARLQHHLFQDEVPPAGAEDDSVSIFSAPGESRECVEVVRRVAQEAERGVPFDRMAILVQSVSEHRRHLEEALARAGVPAYFARGALAPDPAGRAFVSLLACATEGLSARRFAEYLSVGEVPSAEEDGAPPPSLPTSESWVPPDDELIPDFLLEIAISAELAARERRAELEDRASESVDPDGAPVQAGTLRVPRRWEQLLNDAAVIGGHDRWVRRLDGLARELRHRLAGLDEPTEPAGDRVREQLRALEGLRRFALPLIEMLDALPREASWGEWIEQLSALATRALRRPQRVLSVLAELRPMTPIGPVALAEIRLVLGRRLTEMVVAPTERRYGAVLVASPDAVRGLPPFDVVFVVGLAEKLFPRRILEDPVLADDLRRQLGADLATNSQRVERERLALRLALGAARRRVYLSYPRLDLQHARPRVPSFYALEVLRAVRGRLPGFGELARVAEVAGAARLSWPAPERARLAIDDAEHDLALLEPLLRDDSGADSTAGRLALLLTTNPHLARSVRFRNLRWGNKWTVADGLVRPSPAAREALARHQLSSRSYSPTALQCYAACPYRFLLHAVHRLSPREVPAPIDEMDPLQRGALVHEVQFLLFRALDHGGALPLDQAGLPGALEALDQVIEEVASRYEDEFVPAIERVWEDGVASVRADLREWLRRGAEQADGWVPWRFEYAFGIPPGHAGQERDLQDPHSTGEPAELGCGVRLRGKIDLVERNPDGELRVTDHKTGKVRVKQGALVEGGQALQPVFYALAAQTLFGATVRSGRLYYCTVAGGYSVREVVLDDEAVRAADKVAETVRLALERGFLPAAPAEGACTFCDYLAVCGRHEERRVALKGKRALKELLELRELP